MSERQSFIHRQAWLTMASATLQNSDGNGLDLHSLALFSAVIFAGSVVCSRSRIREAFGDISREDLAARLHQHARSIIRLTHFPRAPSTQSLTAYIIIDSTWLRSEQPLACCSFIGVAMRVAQKLGKTYTHYSLEADSKEADRCRSAQRPIKILTAFCS